MLIPGKTIAEPTKSHAVDEVAELAKAYLVETLDEYQNRQNEIESINAEKSKANKEIKTITPELLGATFDAQV